MALPGISSEDKVLLMEQGQAIWPQLRGKRLLLTGGTGFFGKWLTQALLLADRDFDLRLTLTLLVRNLDRAQHDQPWLRTPGLNFVTGDVMKLPASLPLPEQDFFIHTAATASAELNVNKPALMADTIVDGTRNMLRLAASHRGHVPKFLFVSSGAIYGCQLPSITHQSENYLGAPDITKTASAYGEAKRMAELYCQFAQGAGQVDVAIARCFAFVGPYLPLDTHFAAGNFCNDVLLRRAILITGDGALYRSYMYPTDLIHWLIRMLLHVGGGQVYNVGSENDITLRDLALMLDEMRAPLGLSLSAGFEGVTITKTPVSKQERSAYVPSVAKAESELGLRLHVDTRTAFERTLRWYLQSHKKSRLHEQS